MGLDSGGLRNLSDGIPDTALNYHDTPITGLNNGDTVSNWPDKEASGDMDNNTGVTYATGVFSSGKDAISGDGTDVGLAEWSDLGSWMVNDHAIEVTVTNHSSRGEILSLASGYIIALFTSSGNNRLKYRLDDANSNGGAIEASNSQIQDGNDHWVLINKITNDESNWEMYVDDPDSPVSTSNPTTGFGGVQPSISEAIGILAVQDGTNNVDADLGTVIRHDSSLSQSERQDRYNSFDFTA